MTDGRFPEVQELATAWRAAGRLLGVTVDPEARMVTLYVPAGEELPGLPYQLDDLDVQVHPLPRPHALRTA